MSDIQQILANPVVEAIGWTLIHFLWQGSAAALLLVILMMILRRSSANVRYIAAWCVFTLMALSPGVTFWAVVADRPLPATVQQLALPVISDPIEPSPFAPSMHLNQVSPETVLQPDPANARVVPIQDPPKVYRLAWRDALAPYLRWFVAAWFCGVTYLTIRLFLSWSRVQRIRRRTQPASIGWQQTLRQLAHSLSISRPVQLLESALVEVPTVIGWIKPVILVPTSAIAGLTPDKDGRFQLQDVPGGFRFQILIEPPVAEPPWLAWATPPLEFREPGQRELSVSSATTDFTADRFRIQLVGPGINWRTALSQAANQKIDHRGENVRRIEVDKRVHIDADSLQFRISHQSSEQ